VERILCCATRLSKGSFSGAGSPGYARTSSSKYFQSEVKRSKMASILPLQIVFAEFLNQPLFE
jgi:hypothetical protein